MSDAIYMLNALWFKEQGGKEKYAEYASAVAPLLEGVGASPGQIFQAKQALIGDWAPDAFFVVKYPNKSAFEAMISSPEYAEISHLREDALEKSLLTESSEFSFN